MLTTDAIAEAGALVALYRQRGLTIVSAESCTGGLVAALLTAIPGSSAVFERGFVTYSNAAKREALGVGADLLDGFGAVSAEVAHAMAFGALDHSRADVAVSVTGIAGPGGGSPEKPVGLVHFASARRGGNAVTLERRFDLTDRSAIRAASVRVALEMLREAAAPIT